MEHTIKTNRTFGIELEGYGVCRERIVSELASKHIVANTASYAGRNYSEWQIKTDSSINGSYGFEIVSPILNKSRIEELKTVIQVINELGGTVNNSCGLHIHWGVSDWKLKNFKNFMKRYAKFEKAIDTFMPPSRRGNTNGYCSSLVLDGTERTFKLINKARSLRQLTRNITRGKFSKVNIDVFTRSGTIEIRHHSGTLDFEKIMNWISLTGSMIADADKKKSVKQFKKIRNDYNHPTTTTPETVRITGHDNRVLIEVRTLKQQLKTLLNGMVRVGNITKETRTFFLKREKEIRRVA